MLSPPDPDDWQFEDWASDRVVDQAFELLTLRGLCAADFAGGPQSSPDGEVGPADLASLLANWGPAPKCAPPFFRYKVMDFNTDEDVGPFDLAQLLALWGPCPCYVDADCPSDVCLEVGDCEPLE